MSRIQFTLCGNYEPSDDLDPYEVTKSNARQEVLSLINQQSRALEEIAATVKLSLEEVGKHLKTVAVCRLRR